MSDDPCFFDVAIVGGGPSGLVAANYLARYLRSVIIFDGGDARAKLIPTSHNCPGFPNGISGPELLRRLTLQAQTSGAIIREAYVESAAKYGDGFRLTTTSGMVRATFLILATGIVDLAPPIPKLQSAIANGSVRLCPVCDAYEARGQRMGVIGASQSALKEAIVLKHYSPHVAMLSNDADDFSHSIRVEAATSGIEIWDGVDDLVPRAAGFKVAMSDGSAREVDVVYPAMGCDVRSELAADLDAECDKEGYVLVGEHLNASVEQLYAIGDVAKALNQIAVGFGHAALATSHIHAALHVRNGSMADQSS